MSENYKGVNFLPLFRFKVSVMPYIWVGVDALSNQALTIFVRLFLALHLRSLLTRGYFFLVVTFLIVLFFFFTNAEYYLIRFLTFFILFSMFYDQFDILPTKMLESITFKLVLSYFVSLIIGVYFLPNIYFDAEGFAGSRGLVYSGNEMSIAMSVLAFVTAKMYNKHSTTILMLAFYISLLSLVLIATKLALIVSLIVIYIAFNNRYSKNILLFFLFFFISMMYLFQRDFSVINIFYMTFTNDSFLDAISSHRFSRLENFEFSLLPSHTFENFEIDFVSLLYNAGIFLFIIIIPLFLISPFRNFFYSKNTILFIVFLSLSGHAFQSIISTPAYALLALFCSRQRK